MDNAEKYHFADFTRENYRNLLRLAKDNYSFRLFTDSVDQSGVIFWRHDVDYSPQAALKLAQIEKEEGIKSTYFVLLHSEFYNLLEKDSFVCFQKILDAGHQLGIHFDNTFYTADNEKLLEENLKTELAFLQSVFKIKLHAFSFHNPFAFELTCKKDFYAGLINTYATRFHNDIGYCSDSNGYWRFERLEDILVNKKHKSLQVLTHPEWWQDQIMSPRQRVMRCIDGRSHNLKAGYDHFLKINKRENIDW